MPSKMCNASIAMGRAPKDGVIRLILDSAQMTTEKNCEGKGEA
jgi:hypothetical protein